MEDKDKQNFNKIFGNKSKDGDRDPVTNDHTNKKEKNENNN